MHDLQAAAQEMTYWVGQMPVTHGHVRLHASKAWQYHRSLSAGEMQ